MDKKMFTVHIIDEVLEFIYGMAKQFKNRKIC